MKNIDSFSLIGKVANFRCDCVLTNANGVMFYNWKRRDFCTIVGYLDFGNSPCILVQKENDDLEEIPVSKIRIQLAFHEKIKIDYKSATAKRRQSKLVIMH